MGAVQQWVDSEGMLAAVLEARGIPYEIGEGEGAFYGPKIDIHVRDAIGRRWQMSTIQLDFNLPERFDLTYTAPGNASERPLMIHCAKAGSVERFIGVLVEHYAGAFPMWLAPVQVTVVPVADRHHDHAVAVESALRFEGLRCEVDSSTETVGEKIRRALSAKSPAVVVVGDTDVERNTVGLRYLGEDADRRGVPLDDAVAELTERAAAPGHG